MGAETFAFIIAMFGLAFLIFLAVIPLWIMFLATRWLLRQINLTWNSFLNINKK